MKQCMTPVDDYILDVRPTNELEFMIGPTTGAPTTFLATAIQPTPAWLLLSGPKQSPVGCRQTAHCGCWFGRTTLAICNDAMVGLVVCTAFRRR